MDICHLWLLCVLKVQVPAPGRSLIQRSPTERAVSKWMWSRNLAEETWAQLGCRAIRETQRDTERERERERERDRKKYFVKYKITWQAREYFLWYAVWCSLNVTDMNNFPWLSLFYATCRFIAQFFILFLTVSMSLLSEDIHKFKRQTDDRTQNFTLLKKDTHLKRIK